jgi:hypothetical protein
MKFKTAVFTVLSILITISCTQKREGEEKKSLLSNLVSITDNEDKGIKEILEFYGGYCEYSVGMVSSTKQEDIKYFELKVSKSDAIEKYSNVLQMPASNIAFLFFRNLKNEKENYDEIRTVILLKNGKETTFIYSKKELKIVEERIPSIQLIVEEIKKKNFQAVGGFINNKSMDNHIKSDLIKNLEKINARFGEVEEFLPYGFRFQKDKNGLESLHVSGIVKRDIESHEFSADFDLNAPKNELLKIDYKF